MRDDVTAPGMSSGGILRAAVLGIGRCVRGAFAVDRMSIFHTFSRMLAISVFGVCVVLSATPVVYAQGNTDRTRHWALDDQEQVRRLNVLIEDLRKSESDFIQYILFYGDPNNYGSYRRRDEYFSRETKLKTLAIKVQDIFSNLNRYGYTIEYITTKINLSIEELSRIKSISGEPGEQIEVLKTDALQKLERLIPGASLGGYNEQINNLNREYVRKLKDLISFAEIKGRSPSNYSRQEKADYLQLKNAASESADRLYSLYEDAYGISAFETSSALHRNFLKMSDVKKIKVRNFRTALIDTINLQDDIDLLDVPGSSQSRPPQRRPRPQPSQPPRLPTSSTQSGVFIERWSTDNLLEDLKSKIHLYQGYEDVLSRYLGMRGDAGRADQSRDSYKDQLEGAKRAAKQIIATREELVKRGFVEQADKIISDHHLTVRRFDNISKGNTSGLYKQVSYGKGGASGSNSGLRIQDEVRAYDTKLLKYLSEAHSLFRKSERAISRGDIFEINESKYKLLSARSKFWNTFNNFEREHLFSAVTWLRDAQVNTADQLVSVIEVEQTYGKRDSYTDAQWNSIESLRNRISDEMKTLDYILDKKSQLLDKRDPLYSEITRKEQANIAVNQQKRVELARMEKEISSLGNVRKDMDELLERRKTELFGIDEDGADWLWKQAASRPIRVRTYVASGGEGAADASGARDSVVSTSSAQVNWESLREDAARAREQFIRDLEIGGGSPRGAGHYAIALDDTDPLAKVMDVSSLANRYKELRATESEIYSDYQAIVQSEGPQDDLWQAYARKIANYNRAAAGYERGLNGYFSQKRGKSNAADLYEAGLRMGRLKTRFQRGAAPQLNLEAFDLVTMSPRQPLPGESQANASRYTAEGILIARAEFFAAVDEMERAGDEFDIARGAMETSARITDVSARDTSIAQSLDTYTDAVSKFSRVRQNMFTKLDNLSAVDSMVVDVLSSPSVSRSPAWSEEKPLASDLLANLGIDVGGIVGSDGRKIIPYAEKTAIVADTGSTGASGGNQGGNDESSGGDGSSGSGEQTGNTDGGDTDRTSTTGEGATSSPATGSGEPDGRFTIKDAQARDVFEREFKGILKNFWDYQGLNQEVVSLFEEYPISNYSDVVLIWNEVVQGIIHGHERMIELMNYVWSSEYVGEASSDVGGFNTVSNLLAGVVEQYSRVPVVRERAAWALGFRKMDGGTAGESGLRIGGDAYQWRMPADESQYVTYPRNHPSLDSQSLLALSQDALNARGRYGIAHTKLYDAYEKWVPRVKANKADRAVFHKGKAAIRTARAELVAERDVLFRADIHGARWIKTRPASIRRLRPDSEIADVFGRDLIEKTIQRDVLSPELKNLGAQRAGAQRAGASRSIARLPDRARTDTAIQDAVSRAAEATAEHGSGFGKQFSDTTGWRQGWSGGGTSQSGRAGQGGDTSQGTALEWFGWLWDGTGQDGDTSQGGTGQDGTGQDGDTSQGGAGQDGTGQDGDTSQGGTGQDGTGQDGDTSQGGAGQDGTGQDGDTSQGGAGQDGTGQDGDTSQDATGQDATGQDGTGQDGDTSQGGETADQGGAGGDAAAERARAYERAGVRLEVDADGRPVDASTGVVNRVVAPGVERVSAELRGRGSGGASAVRENSVTETLKLLQNYDGNKLSVMRKDTLTRFAESYTSEDLSGLVEYERNPERYFTSSNGEAYRLGISEQIERLPAAPHASALYAYSVPGESEPARFLSPEFDQEIKPGEIFVAGEPLVVEFTPVNMIGAISKASVGSSASVVVYEILPSEEAAAVVPRASSSAVHGVPRYLNPVAVDPKNAIPSRLLPQGLSRGNTDSLLLYFDVLLRQPGRVKLMPESEFRVLARDFSFAQMDRAVFQRGTAFDVVDVSPIRGVRISGESGRGVNIQTVKLRPRSFVPAGERVWFSTFQSAPRKVSVDVPWRGRRRGVFGGRRAEYVKNFEISHVCR